MAIDTVWELFAQLFWESLDAWFHWRILGRSWYWLLFLILGAGSVWAFGKDGYVFGFILAILAMAFLVPAYLNED